MVETDWLEEHLEHENVVVVDCEQQDSFRRAYRRAHIPGAVSVLTPHFKNSPDDEAHVKSPEKFAHEMSQLGIGDDTLVITYDCHRNLYATRLWYLLSLYGHENVKVLNGGWTKWCQEGKPTANKASHNPTKIFTPKLNESFRRRAEYIMASLERSDVLILDVRDTDEYHGSSTVPETVPFPPTKRQGHIPGATHLEINYVNNHDILEDAEWTFRPAGELFSMFQEAGVTPDKEIITYCEHGTRSSQTVFALRLLGYETARLYDGGWMDWGNREDLPVEI